MFEVGRIWVTAKGVSIPIAAMGDDHLANSIAMIERRRWQDRFPQYPRLLREQEARTLAYRFGVKRPGG